MEEAEAKFKQINEAYTTFRRQHQLWIPLPGDQSSDDEEGSFYGTVDLGRPVPWKFELPCTLEELYLGAEKKRTLARDVVDASGATVRVKETISKKIEPGWRNGRQIAVSEKGVAYVVRQLRHPVFRRRHNDLVVTKAVRLVDALAGFTFELTTLDGRTLTITIDHAIYPGYEEVIPMEGMPLEMLTYLKGDLKIVFDVKFPEALTPGQKTELKKLLPS